MDQCAGFLLEPLRIEYRSTVLDKISTLALSSQQQTLKLISYSYLCLIMKAKYSPPERNLMASNQLFVSKLVACTKNDLASFSSQSLNLLYLKTLLFTALLYYQTQTYT
jgi:hypothetical protein